MRAAVDGNVPKIVQKLFSSALKSMKNMISAEAAWTVFLLFEFQF